MYNLQTTYLQDSNQLGHVSIGFEGFLSSSKSMSSMDFPPSSCCFFVSLIGIVCHHFLYFMQLILVNS